MATRENFAAITVSSGPLPRPCTRVDGLALLLLEPPFEGERPFAVLAFTVVVDRAVAIDVFNDPELVAKLDIRGITA